MLRRLAQLDKEKMPKFLQCHPFVDLGIGMLTFFHRKVMDRGERIDSLLDKTSALKAESVGSSGAEGMLGCF